MRRPYNSTWDERRKSDAFDKKFREWKKRDWTRWLEANLIFPFQVKRVEDWADEPFAEGDEKKPFYVGHKFKVLSIEMEDDLYGLIVRAREGRRIGAVPLCTANVRKLAAMGGRVAEEE